jgi:hypothetical protein
MEEKNMEGLANSGFSISDPQVLVMTLCTGICAGMILSIFGYFIPIEIMVIPFVFVTALMVFLEGSWLFFWYKPSLSAGIIR